MPELFYRPHCPPNTTSHIIQPGDTLYSLARQYGTSVDAIIALNIGLNPGNLPIGQMICIPMPGAAPSCEGGTYYAIRPGDTLYAIARANNIPLSTLAAANPGVNPNALMPGQVICIPYMTAPPECPAGYAPYTIVAGDTMHGLARRYNVPLSALLAANPTVDANSIHIGQTICVPQR